MANVNLTTGKIYGAEQGSKKYWHEVGHLKFEDESMWGNLTRQIQNLSMRFLIFVMAFAIISDLALFKFIMVLLLIGSIASEFYEEIWCWEYANRQIKEAKECDNSRKETA